MNKPSLPTLPTSPTLPTLPTLPSLPTLPTFQISLKHRTQAYRKIYKDDVNSFSPPRSDIYFMLSSYFFGLWCAVRLKSTVHIYLTYFTVYLSRSYEAQCLVSTPC